MVFPCRISPSEKAGSCQCYRLSDMWALTEAAAEQFGGRNNTLEAAETDQTSGNAKNTSDQKKKK